MWLLLLAYLGGALTILSPCILPVIPFVFARSERSFWRSSGPLLAGMAVTFAVVATVASIGGGWAVQANAYGRYAALVVLAIFAATLLFPQLAERVTRPLVRLGSDLSGKSSERGSITQSFVLGIATGLLWAPCAGPILGLVLTGAALGGGRVWTGVLLFAYALGAATSLGVAIFAGKNVLDRLKRSLGIEEIIRKVLGVAVLIGVVAIASGVDTGLLTKLSEGSVTHLEQGLVARFHPSKHAAVAPQVASSGNAGLAGVTLDDEGPLPALPAASTWVNSPPLTKVSLRGHVVLVDFWTYSCINCLRSLPYVRAWADTYRKDGLIVIGVHTPEFAFEKERPNVVKAISDLKIDYPVALDNDYTVWNAFQNEYWPAEYLIDAKGRVRYHSFGEGDYDKTEAAIRTLLTKNGAVLAGGDAQVAASGVEKAADGDDMQTPETYLGEDRRANFVSDAKNLKKNQWTLFGDWTAAPQSITAGHGTPAIRLRFHARDVHIVLGPPASGSARFAVTVDGRMPGTADAGVDVNAAGEGVVTSNRLYQIVRQHNGVGADHLVEIKFLDPGTQAYSFTFG